jgi:hypothetical protein
MWTFYSPLKTIADAAPITPKKGPYTGCCSSIAILNVEYLQVPEISQWNYLHALTLHLTLIGPLSNMAYTTVWVMWWTEIFRCSFIVCRISIGWQATLSDSKTNRNITLKPMPMTSLHEQNRRTAYILRICVRIRLLVTEDQHRN